MEIQLGMSRATANSRLVKDLLWAFVHAAGHVCFRCGKPMTRDNFTIDHKEEWLHSADPVRLFFSLENIAYSHQKCNSGAARRPTQKYFTPEEKRAAALLSQRKSSHKGYTPEKRRARYQRTGN